MACIRKGYCIALTCLMFFTNASAQVIYYPVNSSSLLKSTVEDVAGLLQKAVDGSHFSIAEYTSLPATGIVLVYDSTITDNQLCKVQGNGVSYLQFNAAEDNGLAFGIYQFLGELGFKFYQPGSIWEIIPSLSSPFKNIQKEYNTPFKYKTWFISGGHRPWIMDKTVAFDWDIYGGENGHNWSLYQRRNGMTGAFRFTGHRGDIINGTYLSTIQNNPCYIASYNGSRQATSSSVPDVNNNAAKQLWAQTIQQKYTQYSNTIKNNRVYFRNQFRNFNYFNHKIGIEVPDGARWANTTDSLACATGVIQTEADQNIVLANYTARKIKEIYPAQRFQMYAYFTHASVPSASIPIDSSIDIQVPMAFQSESSSKGLLNRWYSRHKSISEYHYMNIPAWSGETPSFYLAELKQTLKRLKEKNSQGIYWEASPAKFASLPFLWASNLYLINNRDVEDALLEFCNQMFGPASETVFELLHQMTNENTITLGGSTADNFYKLPLFFKMLQQASLQTMQSDDLVKQRINELKVYFHYMSLYYDCNFNQKINILEKQSKTAELCIYLARINKMQLVNSYYLITSLISRFKSDDAFIAMYNVKNGTAYQNGNLSLITKEQVEQDFQQDLSKYLNLVNEYNIQSEAFVAAKITASNFIPAEKIQIKIGYSNGSNFPNRSVFGIQAKSKGSFSIQYTPRFDIAGVGYINFTVEKTDKGLGVVKDFSINASSGAGVLQVDIPEAGEYILCITSKQKSGVEILINTNGFAFNKNTAFLGKGTEDYSKNKQSLPGYYYVPEGMRKVYFNIHNSYIQGKGFAKKEVISDVFIFKDNLGNRVHPVYANTSDSSLFYIEIPIGQSGSFWQVSNMGQFYLCFDNISNLLWYGYRKPCTTTDFSLSIEKKGDECFIKLAAPSGATNIRWEVYDRDRIIKYNNEKVLWLPVSLSPNASIVFYNSSNCSVVKKLSEIKNYYQLIQSCASGAALPDATLIPQLYPNPSSGIFIIKTNLPDAVVEKLVISDASGSVIKNFGNVQQINISDLPAALYWYQLVVNQKNYRGKLIKL